MTLKELCSRNVSAGLREVLNAANAASEDRRAEGGGEVDDATEDLIRQAAECLERAAENLSRRPRKVEPVAAVAPGAPILAEGDGKPAKAAAGKK